jgi:hypothetical protein
VTWSGTPSAATNDFAIRLVDGMPLKSTIAFWSAQPDSKPFLGGTLWVKTPVRRLGLKTSDLAGSVTYPIPVDATMPGTRRHFQFWFRDPLQNDNTGVGLSAALEVRFCPQPPPPAAGDVIVTEVLKDPTFVGDAAGEWIELYNTTSIAIDVEGWSLADEGGESVALWIGGLGILVPAQGRIVLGASADPQQNGGVAVAAAWSWSAFKLDNADDEVVLVAPGGVEVDRIAYDNGFLWPDTPGRSLSLTAGVLDHLGNDDGNAWCHGNLPIGGANGDTGTPGAPNESCP